jgi:predicted RNA-binding protein YlxR (DUF448 family)
LNTAGETTEADESDAGPRDRAGGSTRLCIATRAVLPTDQLIRFVAGPDDAVVPDIKRRLPGRGVWVTATAAAIDKAVARNAFSRSLKRPARAGADLAAMTDRLLEKATLDALAIAYKAGVVLCGFTKVESALTAGTAIAIMHASDAAPDGVRKLDAIRRRHPGDTISIMDFTGPQLDLAFGRPNVIHAALLAGPASAAFLARFRGLTAFRGSETADRIATALL